ncbi:MAG: efflux RND transporter periplasmic adaptor subunit [Flavobacterium sp.]|jgi:Cu(I)/Ag(I) efflux system membrane fusion protein|uniref:Efflux RND transporter periplasmic adaptor subunit n=4 Tax=Flavobacteriaceae TaxID=49546 RepID=A0A4R5CKB4_9FLAO|nr:MULTISPECIES: efflux RND transporter periplasmic adaptor subunit [unclassified Flavobacterium]MBC5841673.1 efflux RND transporter periplasmic adaptor subunit [Flavobacterium kayseriense]MDP3682096.1 efflux RND transporter periplasmic adaptor subunit [Flavobacterium sp.]RBN50752.1 efflux RND transporter periplasmic adaptor subunit [Flavobacterium psychrolimnae]TDE00749.1 efflux RND transporter periplasmic adaptor subunit [Flavobacterium sandaracinum]MBC5848201.1 efflux RND transporter peripl
MKTIKKISLLSILFMVMVACNTKEKEDHSKHNKSAATTFYTCSMDPQVKEDKPGKCPICHMELTPIKQDDTEANEISLSKQQIQLGNITTQTISETQSSLEQNYTGVLTINQEKIKTISSRAMGRIEKLYFKTVGDYVAKNQAVYQLYSEDIAIAKQDYFTAYKQLAMPGDFGKNARNMLNAAKQKLLFFGLTNAQIESIKTSKEVSPYTIFYSTASGTISEISTTEGSYAMEGSPIIKLADLNSLWLETQVNVNYAKNLKIGQKAQITFSDFPDKTINAQVSFINPEINPDTRLLLIRMEVPNQNLLLKPGMQAIARLTQSNIKGVFIPTDAVIREENASYIWIEKRPGVFESIMVETGVETNGMIEIKSEMDPSKKVVITGAYAINSEYKFRKGNDPMEGMKM